MGYSANICQTESFSAEYSVHCFYCPDLRIVHLQIIHSVYKGGGVGRFVGSKWGGYKILIRGISLVVLITDPIQNVRALSEMRNASD